MSDQARFHLIKKWSIVVSIFAIYCTDWTALHLPKNARKLNGGVPVHFYLVEKKFSTVHTDASLTETATWAAMTPSTGDSAKGSKVLSTRLMKSGLSR